MNVSKINYNIKKDIETFLEIEKCEIDTLSKDVKVSKNTIKEILKRNVTTNSTYEKIYSFLYYKGYRINETKEEFLIETHKNVLFHGSKNFLTEITSDGSRKNCDFGSGFYLGESYDSALSFVCDNDNSYIYSFTYNPKDLKIIKFDCSMEWMLAICYHRGTIKDYEKHKIIKKIINKIEKADLIIAPIADNRMFYIMSLFATGDINSEIALHSLSASNLGLQYVFKTEKAINALKVIERYYISEPERDMARKKLKERANFVESKLKMSKREFRDGLYIEEILK